MIHYNIDTYENGHDDNIEGNAASPGEMNRILFDKDEIPYMVGYIEFDDIPDISICISARKELGFFICITDKKNVYLSLGDKNTLNETVDVWDELYVSKGLFIPFSIARKVLGEYLASRKLSEDITWITPDELPENGNYIE